MIYNNGSKAPVFYGTRRCLYCGKQFKPRSNRQFHCDKKCMRLNSRRRMVYKRKDVQLTCVICGEPIIGEARSIRYHNQKDCAIKARYYREVRRWLNSVKKESIKNSIDYILLREKVKKKIENYKCSVLKLNRHSNKKEKIKAIAKKIWYPKAIDKQSQMRARPYVKKFKWKKHQRERDALLAAQAATQSGVKATNKSPQCGNSKEAGNGTDSRRKKSN